MNISEIIKRATDPNQYDSGNIAWQPGISLNSSIRVFIWNFLKPHVPKWENKKVLELGAGSGWLMEEARKAGAKRVVGIEPSRKNFEAARTMFPASEMLNISVEEFESEEKFDVVVSILALSHFSDLESVFRKVSGLLKSGGEFLVVTIDYDFYKTERFGYKIQVEIIDSGTYATLIENEGLFLADIVRKDKVYIERAKHANLSHLETVPMKVDATLVASKPKFQEFAGVTIFNLMRFKKE